MNKHVSRNTKQTCRHLQHSAEDWTRHWQARSDCVQLLLSSPSIAWHWCSKTKMFCWSRLSLKLSGKKGLVRKSEQRYNLFGQARQVHVGGVWWCHLTFSLLTPGTESPCNQAMDTSRTSICKTMSSFSLVSDATIHSTASPVWFTDCKHPSLFQLS